MTTREMSVGVVTIVAGRRRHLARQFEGLVRQTRPADHVVVVRMDDEDLTAPGAVGDAVSVIDVPHDPRRPDDGRLPLAAARNAGVRAAGTDVVVLLDVDCIPGDGLVDGYGDALSRVDGLVCGELRYLRPDLPAADSPWTEPDLRAGSDPHPARPAPGPGRLVRDDRHELAWTTSLGLRTASFEAVGGFDEDFRGYGAEDTDFAFRAAARGLGVWWTGAPVAYHQHHPAQSPPVQHLDDIVRNARLFADRHGWFPMTGWLREFDRRGLIHFDPEHGVLTSRRVGV